MLESTRSQRILFLWCHLAILGLIILLSTANEILVIHSYYTQAPTLIVDKRTETWLAGIPLVVCVFFIFARHRAPTPPTFDESTAQRIKQDMIFHAVWLLAEAGTVVAQHYLLRGSHMFWDDLRAHKTTLTAGQTLSKSRTLFAWNAAIAAVGPLVPGAAYAAAVWQKHTFRSAAGGIGVEFWFNGALLFGRQLTRFLSHFLSLQHLMSVEVIPECNNDHDIHVTCQNIRGAAADAPAAAQCTHCSFLSLLTVVLAAVAFGIAAPAAIQHMAVTCGITDTDRYSATVNQMTMVSVTIALFSIDSHPRHQSTQDIAVTALFTAAGLLASTLGRATTMHNERAPDQPTAVLKPRGNTYEQPPKAELRVVPAAICTTARSKQTHGSVLRMRPEMGARKQFV